MALFSNWKPMGNKGIWKNYRLIILEAECHTTEIVVEMGWKNGRECSHKMKSLIMVKW